MPDERTTPSQAPNGDAQTRAWRQLHRELAERAGPPNVHRGWQPGSWRWLLPATLLLAVTATPAALGARDDDGPTAGAARGEGRPVELGERNPSSGGSARETAIVARNGNNGLVVRPSNTAKGGRAISATCDNDGLEAEDGCAVYVNKGQGAAATFRTQGSVPFAIRETNNGVVQHLNADMVDGKHASELEGAQGPAGPPGPEGPQGPQGPQGPAGDNLVRAAGSADNFGCDPVDSNVFVECASVTLDLPEDGTVLVIAAGTQYSGGSDPANGANGDCQIHVDGSEQAGNSGFVEPGETSDDTNSNAQNGFGITIVVPGLSAGEHEFALACDEDVNDQQIHAAQISALFVG